MNQDQIMTFYWRVCDLWKRFCEEHATLYELTLREYTYLLESNVDAIEGVVENKTLVIEAIALLDDIRSEIIRDLNFQLNDSSITSVSELINFMKVFENKLETPHLEKFNDYLIDTIMKIQAQNKKNQIFINKTLLSLKTIREETMGTKNYSTYNSKGSTKHTSP